MSGSRTTAIVLFGRLQPLIGGEPPELPTPENYSALVDDLYSPLIR
jgi:hypothetical protein